MLYKTTRAPETQRLARARRAISTPRHAQCASTAGTAHRLVAATLVADAAAADALSEARTLGRAEFVSCPA